MARNTNALEGWRCPSCGNTDAFDVWGTCTFTLTDDGTTDERDVDFDDDSRAQCRECGYKMTVATFTAGEGDDDAG